MRIPFRLVFGNLLRHPLRSLLTSLSVGVAMFLLCLLQSVVTTLDAAVTAAASNRVCVQSAVSLYVNLPLSYRSKIEGVDGVRSVCAWQWFGGVYQDPKNFFAQFAVDHDTFLDMYPEIRFLSGSPEAFLRERQACIVGKMLAEKFGFEVGQSVPLEGALYPRTDGQPWQMKIAGIYESDSASIDDNTMFFHFDYLRESLEQGAATGPDGNDPTVGVFVVEVEPGRDPVQVMSAIDAQFANGPQRVHATSESEFQAQFVTMMGSVPFFVGAIGAGVLAAILLAVLNTMLMAAREQIHDTGILKALGFSSPAVFAVLLLQSLVISTAGGAVGILAARPVGDLVAARIGMMLAGFRVDGHVQLLAALVTVALGLVAGIVPARHAARLDPVAALRAR